MVKPCKNSIDDYNACSVSFNELSLFIYFINFLFDCDFYKNDITISNDNLEYKQIIDNLLPIKEKLLNDSQYLKYKQYVIEGTQHRKTITVEMYNSFINILQEPNENNVINFLNQINK